MSKPDYDFCGWATRNDLLCSDGRTIRQNAFADDDGLTVPLVWNHQHDAMKNVLGHALLKNTPEGVRAYGYFNDTEEGQHAKKSVQNGDITALSIYANGLKQTPNRDVVHGRIREVSLVLAGANIGAVIDDVVEHADGEDFSAEIYTGEEGLELFHAEEPKPEEKKEEEAKMAETEEKKPDDKKTVQDVIDTMNEEQKTVLYALVGSALEDKGEEPKNENPAKEEEMKHNLFEGDTSNTQNVLSHADEKAILKLAKTNQVGSLKAAMDIYAEENGVTLAHADVSGFENVETLFPEYRDVRPGAPELVTDDLGWVDVVMNKTQKVPFNRIRTQLVDIRDIDNLQAKGYKKGNEKKLTGNFKLVRRETDPQTLYVKSTLNRDDIQDLSDFDYVDYQYKADTISLKQTLAEVTMLGDSREETDADYIAPEHIRPIWTDDELYTIHKDIDVAATKSQIQGSNTSASFGESFIYSESMVDALTYAREDFRGTGRGDFFADPAVIDKMMLARDMNGRRLYQSEAELATALGVASIQRVTKFKNKIRKDSEGNNHKLLAIVVNMNDYAYGANKGGDVAHFTDFDIDFNQNKSLIETRKCGALTRIKSAIVIEEAVAQG